MKDERDEWYDPEKFAGNLGLYVQAIEEFVPYISAQLQIRQRSRLATQSQNFPPEEIDYLVSDLRSSISSPLTRTIRGSALVVIYAVFETTALSYAETIDREIGTNSPFNPRSERGEFISKITRHYSDVLGVKLFVDSSEYSGLNTLKALRHSFVHNQCSISALPKWLKAEMLAQESPLSHCRILENLWIPTASCINAHSQLLGRWQERLLGRVIDRVGLDTFL